MNTNMIGKLSMYQFVNFISYFFGTKYNLILIYRFRINYLFITCSLIIRLYFTKIMNKKTA